MDIKNKNIFRKKALLRLSEIKKSRAYIYDKKIINLLKSIFLSTNPRSIMIYTPMPIEVNVHSLIQHLRRMGVAVYVPFMVDESFILVKYRLPLKKKQFGIYEPKFSKQYRKRQIDIAIVPVLGIDQTFRRIGFGKGMYDRFFEKDKKNIGKIIFVQRVLCFSPNVITSDHDISADYIITKEGCFSRAIY